MTTQTKIKHSVITQVDLGDGVKVTVNINKNNISLTYNTKKKSKQLSLFRSWDVVKEKFQADWEEEEGQ